MHNCKDSLFEKYFERRAAMMKRGWVWVVLMIAFFVWAGQGWAEDESAAPSQSVSQPSPSSGCKMMGGGMGHGKGGMMQEKKHEGMGMHRAMGGQRMAGAHEMHGMRGLMSHFHGWMHRLMANRQAVGLTPEQLEQIDLAMAEHRKFALRSRAEAAALRIDLKRELRKKSPDLKSVETLVRNIAEEETKTEMEGIRAYASVLNMFTDEQRAKVGERVGTPFPRPWEEPVKSEAAAEGSHHGKGATSAERPAGEQTQPAASGHAGGSR
jgi:hypothetical protein